MKINRSVKRSIDILNIISQSKTGLTLAQIQKELELPKSSTFDLVQTLLATNMITTSSQDEKLYIIGVNSFLIGASYESDLIKVSKKYLKRLADELGKTIFLGIEKDGEVVYIDKAEPQSAIFTIATLGSTNPIHCTSLGKAIVSQYSDEKIKKIIEAKGMAKFTNYTLTNEGDFFKDIELTRERRYAIDNRELEEQMLCIGSPIFNSQNKVVAAISASGIFVGYDDVDSQGKKIKETALEISRALGCRC